MTDVLAPRDERRPTGGTQFTERVLPWVLVGGGILGLAAAFVLTVEKIALLRNPAYVPSCSINPVLSCGSVMSTPQAEAFGFPNSLIGVAGFAVATTVGFAVLGGARFAPWFWLGLQIGVTFGVVFVHWLIFQSLYRIGALCPYCMVVWAVVIPMFWYVSLRNASRRRWSAPALARAVTVLNRYHTVVLTVWFLVIAAAVLHAFWTYWMTLV